MKLRHLVITQIARLDELAASKDTRTFDNTLRPLDKIGDILAHAFTNYAFMGYVHVDKDVRDAAKTAEEKASQFGVEMIFRDDLNTAVQEYATTSEASSLQGEQARFLEFTLRDLRKAGHDLDPEMRSTVKEKTERLVTLGVQFQQNIDEWDDWILVTRDELLWCRAEVGSDSPQVAEPGITTEFLGPNRPYVRVVDHVQSVG